MKILVVSQSDVFGDATAAGLRKEEGFRADTAELREHAHQSEIEEIAYRARHFEYDAVLLFVPVGDERRVLEILRRGQGSANVSVVAVTVGGMHERVAALWGGADDCLSSPLHYSELVARIKAVVRRRQMWSRMQAIGVGGVSINIETWTVTVGGVPVYLTPTEFDVLEMLFARPNVTQAKAAIHSRLYGGRRAAPGHKIIDVFVCKLRRKLADAGAREDLIETVWGVGWVVRTAQSSSVTMAGAPGGSFEAASA